jgi:hypothetical protein
MTPRGRRAGALWHDAARLITGRDVLVIWGWPVFRHCYGTASREAGRPTIRVMPGLRPSKRFEVFLHECAHVALGHVDTLPDIGAAAPLWAAEPSADHGAYRRSFEERQAGHLVGVWMKEIVRRAGAGSSPATKLRALIEAHGGGRVSDTTPDAG